jgi:hypothetical protein
MVNKCEISVNRHHSQQANDADRLGPKWRAIGTGTQAFPVVDKRSPADREDLTHSGEQAEHVSPYRSLWEGKPQGKSIAMRVEDKGERESRSVMERI